MHVVTLSNTLSHPSLFRSKTLLDYTVCAVLGRGSYGRVFLVRNAGRAYACKMVCKQRTIKQKQVRVRVCVCLCVRVCMPVCV